MPAVEERLALATATMVALVDDAELPPKIGVHPGPDESFAHAMPAWMRGREGDGSRDLLGLKWVVGFPTNATAGIPAIHGSIILSDARTGLPRAIMDAGAITAQRTAAVSGLAIQRWGPASADSSAASPRAPAATTVTMVGAGVQARSHLPVVAHLLPGADVRLCDRDPVRLELLADEVRGGMHGGDELGDVRTETDPSVAVGSADLVLTLVSFGPDRQSIPEHAFRSDATVVAVDYDMCVPAPLARSAAMFLTDDRDQFLANRTAATFADYPEPNAMIGEAVVANTPRPAGRVLISHLGVGLADVVFGDAILRAAEARDIGTILER